MQRQLLTRPGTIILVLLLQLIPLLLFPASSFASTTQEWWLPVLLVVMVLVACIEVIVRRRATAWPWYLISFAHGFNIISRLMMVWPHATVISGDATVANWPYIVLTILAMAMSVFVLWYTEKPTVRIGLLQS